MTNGTFEQSSASTPTTTIETGPSSPASTATRPGRATQRSLGLPVQRRRMLGILINEY
jgi:hypothetical protein